MAMARVRSYLQANEGREVPYQELLDAGLAPSEATLHSDLSRLVANPAEGITMIGDIRVRGMHRGYRYVKPAAPEPPQLVTLRLIGQTADGYGLAQDDETMRIYEIVPRGRLDYVAGPAA